MTIDLDDIERRINDGIYGDDRFRDTQDDAFSALAALLNEVEQLRTEVSYLRACVPPTRPTDYGHEAWTAALDAVGGESKGLGPLNPLFGARARKRFRFGAQPRHHGSTLVL